MVWSPVRLPAALRTRPGAAPESRSAPRSGEQTWPASRTAAPGLGAHRSRPGGCGAALAVSVQLGAQRRGARSWGRGAGSPGPTCFRREGREAPRGWSRISSGHFGASQQRGHSRTARPHSVGSLSSPEAKLREQAWSGAEPVVRARGARPPGAGAWGGGPGPRRRRGAGCRRSYLEEPLGWRQMPSGPESNTGTTGES